MGPRDNSDALPVHSQPLEIVAVVTFSFGGPGNPMEPPRRQHLLVRRNRWAVVQSTHAMIDCDHYPGIYPKIGDQLVGARRQFEQGAAYHRRRVKHGKCSHAERQII